MTKKIPQSAKVVIIGGGVAGCSVAYHLSKFGSNTPTNSFPASSLI